MSLMSAISTEWTIVKADFHGFIAKVASAVKYVETEAGKLLAWVNTTDPAVGAALAVLIHDGEVALEDLATASSTGLATTINALATGVETSIANAIQASGLNINDKTVLTAADVATISAISSAGQSAVQAAIVKVTGAVAPAARAPAATGV